MVVIHSQFEEPTIKEEIEFNDLFMNDLLNFFIKSRVNGSNVHRVRKTISMKRGIFYGDGV